MSKIYFFHGVMGSSKTAECLMTNYRYKQIGKKPLLCKTRLDNRDGARVIKSRIGLEEENVSYLDEVISLTASKLKEYDVIIVDEVQFATREQIIALTDICDNYDIPILCYGLATDFRGEFFEGAKTLFAYADKKIEIKQICHCGKKALFNARVVNGEMVVEGSQVKIGGDESYVALCRKHYKAKQIAPSNRLETAPKNSITVSLNNDTSMVIAPSEVGSRHFISYTVEGTKEDGNINYNDKITLLNSAIGQDEIFLFGKYGAYIPSDEL